VNPMLLMALLGTGGGLLKDLMSPKGTQDLTADWAAKNGRDLNGDRSQAFYDMLSPGGQLDSGSWYNMGRGYAGQAGGQTDRAAEMANRSSGNILEQLLRMQPEMQRSAAGTATGATSRGAASMADLAAEASARARSNMENRFGAGGQFGTTSGGTLAALMRGTSEPLLQAQSNINQMYSGAYQNAFSPMAQGFMAREFGRPQEYQGVASSYQKSADQALGTGGLLAQLLGGQSEQALVAPQFQTQGPTTIDKLIDVGLGAGSQALGYAQLQDLLKGMGKTGPGGLGVQGSGDQIDWSQLLKLYGMTNNGY
jgi:hypothetical protein